MLDTGEQRRSLENLRLERDAITLYDSLAGIEKDPRRAAAFRTIAQNERRHADVWASRLRSMGADVPGVSGPRPRVRLIIGLARVFGTRSVSDLVRALEGDEEDIYAEQDGPDVISIAADEREHAEIWKRLDAGMPALRESPASAEAPAPYDASASAEASAMAAVGAPLASHDGGVVSRGLAPVGAAPVAAGATAPRAPVGWVPARLPERDESWHGTSRSGTLRAAIFGINDGVVSNLSLVMGVAGAAVEPRIIVLAGIAGLLAGAFSMAAGEYISMQSQRETFQRQIELEREEMLIMPEEEERELAGIYRAKGVPIADARRIAAALMEDPEAALDTKVREELGLDPDELGSPWGAAASSFISFGVGAAVPLVPYILLTGTSALIVAFAAAMTSLFLVGAGVSLVTGRGLLFSASRQVLIGAVAASVTFLVGSLIGVGAVAAG